MIDTYLDHLGHILWFVIAAFQYCDFQLTLEGPQFYCKVLMFQQTVLMYLSSVAKDTPTKLHI